MLPKIYSFETRIKVDTSNLNLVAQSCDYFSNQSWCKTQQRPLMFSAIPLHDILQLRSTLLYEVSTVFQSVHFPYYGMNFTWLIERSFTHHKKPLTKNRLASFAHSEIDFQMIELAYQTITLLWWQQRFDSFYSTEDEMILSCWN